MTLAACDPGVDHPQIPVWREACSIRTGPSYYMRGPGPKWHAKHERAPVAYQAVPALVRVRAKR